MIFIQNILKIQKLLSIIFFYFFNKILKYHVSFILLIIKLPILLGNYLKVFMDFLSQSKTNIIKFYGIK